MVIITLLSFGFLLVLLFFGAPLVIAIGLPTLIGFMLAGIPIGVFAQKVYSSVNSYSLMAIPFFMFAGELMKSSGMSKRVVRIANCLVGWMIGGLGNVVVVASVFFGALSGSAPATTAAIGTIMIPEMKKKGFPSDFVAGLQAVSGGLGTIIPPSIPMIIYGVTCGVSIGKLFIAGILPGIFISLFLMVVVYFFAKKRKIPQTGKFSLKELKKSFMDGIWALLVPLIILGGIYSGIFTPTEAGAVAVIYGLFAGIFIYKELNWEGFKEILSGTITNTILVMVIIGVSGAFSWLLTINGIANLVGTTLASISQNKFVFLLLVNLLLLFTGCFMETVAAILILSPILFPISQVLGIDPVHFGIIIVINLSLGMATPPVGENQYIAAAIAKVPFEEEVKASLPFLVAAYLALIFITYIPKISLFLPNLLSF